MSRRDDLQKLITPKQRYLQKLKEQEATYGLASPVHILLDIENTEAELAQLQAELAALPPETDTPAGSPGPAATPPAGGGGPVFNIGTLQAGSVNVGGTQTITGPMTVDLSERNVNVGSGGTYVAGDQMNFSGNFQGAILNVKSQLSNVTQNIGALPNVAQADKDELIRLVNELKSQLEQTPPDKTAEAETLAKRTDKLVKELEEPQPDREMVETMGNSLKRAAENLARALPVVLPIATQIVAYVMKLAG
jgi:hypothetical protein